MSTHFKLWFLQFFVTITFHPGTHFLGTNCLLSTLFLVEKHCVFFFYLKVKIKPNTKKYIIVSYKVYLKTVEKGLKLQIVYQIKMIRAVVNFYIKEIYRNFQSIFEYCILKF